MYLIMYDDEVLHDPRDDTRRVTECTCELEVNMAGNLKFTMAHTHPLYARLYAMSAQHEVVLVQADAEGDALQELFRGRITDVGSDMYSSRDVTCEGQLAYLADSVMEPYGTYPDTISDTPAWTKLVPSTKRAYVEWIVEQHNRQVDQPKQFHIGINEVPEESIVRSSTEWPDTLSEMKAKVLDALGYYVRPSVIDGVRYLDILVAGGTDSPQRIEFGSNLTDYATTSAMSGIHTAVVPQGKRAKQGAENSSETETFGVETYKDGPIPGHDGYTKVANRILSEDGVRRYGLIVRHSAFDDVSTLQGLLDAACAELADAHTVVETLSITAVDLSHIAPDLAPIKLLDWVRVVSAPHRVDSRILCLKISIDIDDPTQTNYTLGATTPTLTHSAVIQERARNQQVADVVESVRPISAEAKAAAHLAQSASNASKGAADAAQQAQKLASSKRRVFTSQPVPPYDVGDLWVDAATGVTHVCMTAKEA